MKKYLEKLRKNKNLEKQDYDESNVKEFSLKFLKLIRQIQRKDGVI